MTRGSPTWRALSLARGTWVRSVKETPAERGRRYEYRAGLPVVTEVAGDIGGDDTTSLQGFGDVDTNDFCMRNLAAQERNMQHPGQLNVVDKQRLTGEKPAIFIAFDRFAECAGGHFLSAPHSFGGGHHRIDDVLITSAAAQIARQRF